MKRHAAVALALAAALPACAQRGGGHAGFAAHSAPPMRSAPAFHGSFAPSPSYHYSSGIAHASMVPSAHAPMIYAPRMPAAGVRYPATVPVIRPTFYHHGGTITTTHNFYVRTYPYPYNYGYGYGYGYYPSVVYVGGFYDDGSYDTTQQPLQEPDNGYPQPGPDYGYPQPDYSYPQPAPNGYAYPQPMPQPQYGYAYPQPMPGYPAYPQPAPQPGYTVEPAPGYMVYGESSSSTPQMQYVPGSSETVILIYKNGHPPEQIQNYLATRTTLTILDGGRRRVVPLDDLDIPATVRANRQTGVDFKLPSVPGTTGCTGNCASSPDNP